MKAPLYLCIHYGFGDYVICYGMVRELAKRHRKIVLFAIPHRSPLHIDNIKRLYGNIDNVIISTDDPREHENVMYIGWVKFNAAVIGGYNLPFANYFYQQAGVPLNLLWDNFAFERNMDREREIYYDLLKLKDGEVYDFLHDDPVRNFVIRKQYIDPAVRTIHLVELEDISILDTLLLVERSRKLHTFTTGLVSFIDQMNIQHPDLNLHQYIRPNTYDQPILKLNWNIIT